MKCNSSAKDGFEAIPLTDFWAKYVHIYKRVGSLVIPNNSFSALVNIKTKSRNKLDCESDLRCALSAAKPRIKLLVSKKQLHPSHWWKLIANKLLLCSLFVDIVTGWGANFVSIVQGGHVAKSLRTPELESHWGYHWICKTALYILR